MNSKQKDIENICLWAMNSALTTMKLDAKRYQKLFEELAPPKKEIYLKQFLKKEEGSLNSRISC